VIASSNQHEVRVRNPLAAVRLASAAALVLWCSGASAAHRITMARAGGQTTYILQEDKVRIEEKGSPRVLIFDGKSMEYFEVDTEKKTWAVATLRDAQAEGQALAQQHEATAPPDQRQRATAERRERLVRWTKLLKDTRFEPTSNQGMVADQMCDGYTERVGGKVVAEGCYIPWNRKTIRKEDLRPMTRLAEFLNTALANVDSAAGIDLRVGPLGRLQRAPGFPAVRYDIAPDGKSGVQLKLVEFVNTLSVTPETFRPPAGYTRLDQPPAVVGPTLERARERAPVAP
jgi:hypothetical protein